MRGHVGAEDLPRGVTRALEGSQQTRGRAAARENHIGGDRELLQEAVGESGLPRAGAALHDQVHPLGEVDGDWLAVLIGAE